MADIPVRNFDDEIVAQLKDRAKIHGRSLEGELREALRDLAMRPRQESVAEAARLRDAIRAKSGVLSDSARYIREDRDLRG